MTDKSDTPIVDEAEDHCSICGLDFVLAEDARTLERRVAALEAGLKQIAHSSFFDMSKCRYVENMLDANLRTSGCPHCKARALLKEGK